MDDPTQEIPSPDGKYFVRLVNLEMAPFQWVNGATLWERDPERELVVIGNDFWNADTTQWSENSQCVTFRLRRFPGLINDVIVGIDVARQRVHMHWKGADTILPLNKLVEALEGLQPD